ncbi:DUF6519 domain-containing protein [Amycolatopsis suaedae]|uniref:DUF6519 domain-containing protein n=1 Tax=Amycolatopsis suaedae TaxID=2510978 RepID=UPI00196AA952|nr:DUF6519 domain-containing protein [Amycolatopsis suaedae]
MQGDFSRVTHDPRKHFSAVLSQQGRVQLDADVNEQAAILLHQIRTAMIDLVGDAATPAGKPGFAIETVPDPKEPGKIVDLTIKAGRTYVDGLLVENDADTTYFGQPDGHLDRDDDELPQGVPYAVYLRVWEQLVHSLVDPSIREVALGDPGPDTAARARVVWQVATHALPTGTTGKDKVKEELRTWLDGLNPRRGRLAVRTDRPEDSDDTPCDLSPESRFRGPENQLYRIEVHSGGQSWKRGTKSGDDDRDDDSCLFGATFKWSRENGSVVFPILSLSGAEVRLADLGRDGKLGLEVGDWVEIVDDASAARVADDVALDDDPVRAPALRRVVAIDAADRRITLDSEQADDGCGTRQRLHPLLRRWDHGPTPIRGIRTRLASDGAVPIVEDVWIDLEDGVQVKFSSPEIGKQGTYRRGDHWQVAARIATGDVEWPRSGGEPADLEPHGVHYHYAPLWFVPGGTATPEDLRRLFAPIEEAGGNVDQPDAAAKPAATRSRRRTTAKEDDDV